MITSIDYPYSIDPNGIVTATEDPTKLYLDRILTLLSTNVGQRPMTPEYGVDWSTALFENDGQAKLAISQAINLAVSKWLPEVTVQKIDINSAGPEGIENVVLYVKLPNDTVTNMTINAGTFNYDGIITR